jgi:hypothetical protein
MKQLSISMLLLYLILHVVHNILIKPDINITVDIQLPNQVNNAPINQIVIEQDFYLWFRKYKQLFHHLVI